MQLRLLLICLLFTSFAYSQALEITVSPDFDYYCTNSEVSASIEGVPEPSCDGDGGPGSYCYGENEYTLFTFCPDIPGDGAMMAIEFLEGSVETGFDTVTIYDGADDTAPVMAILEGDLSGLSFMATNDNGCISFVVASDAIISCESGSQDELVWDVSCDFQFINYVIQWEPAEFCVSPNSITTEIFGFTEDTEFTVEIYHVDFPEDIASGTVAVTYISSIDLGEDSEAELCITDENLMLIDLLEGDPDDVGEWLDPDGNEISGELNPGTDVSGTYLYYHPACTEETQLELIIYDLPVISAGEDVLACAGQTITLEATGGFDYDWGDEGEGQSINILVTESATYTVTGFGPGGCMASDDVMVTMEMVPGAEITEENGVLIASEGTSYQWFLNGNQLIGAIFQEYTPLVDGIFTVLVSIGEGCDSLSEEYVFISDSVEEIEEYGFSLFPNPMKDLAVLEFREGISIHNIRIQDNMGRLILDERVSSNPHVIKGSQLSNGIYVLTIWNKQGDLLESMKLSVR